MIRVEIEGRDEALEFPDDTPQEVIQSRVDAIVQQPAGSPERPRPGPLARQGPPRSLRELTGGLVTREAAMMAGGLFGGALGGALATPTTAGLGTLPALAAGGALGTAGGSLIFDSTEDMLRSIGVLAGRNPSVFERSERALKEGAIDLATAGIAPFIRPILAARALLGRISGVTTKAAQDIAVRARGNFGIDLGALDVGGALPKFFAKLLGIFPFTGSPQRKAFTTKIGQANIAINDILNEIAPNATLGSALSINMTRAAENTFLEFRTTAGRLYDGFRGLAKNATVKEIIPTDNMRGFAKEIADDIKSGRIRKRGTEAADVPGLTGELEEAQLAKEGGKFIAEMTDEVGSYISRLKQLPDLITMEQYRRLVGDLKRLIDKGKFEGFDIKRVVQGKEALEADLNLIRTDLLPDSAEGDAIKSALEAANLFYSKGILQFQKTTGKAFVRVERNIFTSGGKVPGSLNADEVERIAVNLKSPQAVKDLRTLVGDDLINQAARKRVEDAAELATETIEISGKEIVFINPAKLEKELGLAGRKGIKEREGLKELFRTAGVKLEEIEGFIEAARSIQRLDDPAKFATRRVVIGGAGAAVGAVGGAGAALATGANAGLVSAPFVVGTFLARFGSKVFSSPKALKNMTTALAKLSSQAQRQAAVARLMKAMVEDENQRRKIRSLPGPARAVAGAAVGQ